MGATKPRRKPTSGNVGRVGNNGALSHYFGHKKVAPTKTRKKLLKKQNWKKYKFCNSSLPSHSQPVLPRQPHLKSSSSCQCSLLTGNQYHLIAHAMSDLNVLDRRHDSTTTEVQVHVPPSVDKDSEAFQLPLHYGRSETTVSRTSDKEKLYVLGIPLHKLSRTVQFLVCVGGVMVFYLLYGYTQEWIFNVEGFKPFGWYLTLVQFVFYSIFGGLESAVRGEKTRRVPIKTYMFLAFLTVSTMGLSNTSLGYLNYPTQVIFKSCKLIPVMIGGIVIQGKKYTILDGFSLFLMSVGLILFTLADSSMQPNFDMTGVLLISLALCADAVIGNVQEKTLKEHSASNVELVLYSYFVGVFYILFGLLLSGSLIPAFQFCMKTPKMYLMAAIFSLTGYLGINFVLVLVRSFGALLAVTVTTFRKAVTMVLSFLVFTKPFTSQYIWSGLIVMFAIGINVYSKNRTKLDRYIQLKLFRMKLRSRRKAVHDQLCEV